MPDTIFYEDPSFYFNIISASCAIISLWYAKKSISSSKDSEKFSLLSAEAEKKSAEAAVRIAKATENLLEHNMQQKTKEELDAIRSFGVNIYNSGKGFDTICKRISEGYSHLTKTQFENVVLDIAGRVGVAKNLDDLKRNFPERYQ